MNLEETGIVQLEDLPHQEIYISLKDNLYNSLISKIRRIGILKLSQELNISKRILSHWLNGGSLIRLDVLLALCNHFELDLNSQIHYLRCKCGGKIKNPKLPFNFTSNEGVRIIAGIFGDGGIPSKRKNPYYTNSNKDLINGFLNDMNFVFGDLEFSSRDQIKEGYKCTILEFPTLVYKVLIKLGLQSGKKVEINPNIPSFIFNLDDPLKYTFISQYLDDDGTVNPSGRNIVFTNTCLHNKESNLLKDLKNLFLSLEIIPSIYPGERYSSSRGEDRRTWKLQVHGQRAIKKLNKNLKLRHNKKKQNLHIMANSFKQNCFPSKNIIPIYCKFMKKIEGSKGYFTSFDLAQITKRNLGSCRNTILKFERLNLIKCIKRSTSGNSHEYGRFILK